MKKSDLLVVCGAMVFLTGCPYSARHQLGRPSAKAYDPAILGTWVGCEPENKTHCTHLAVYRFNEVEYYAETTESVSPGKTERFRAFMSDIGVPGLIDLQDVNISTDAIREHVYVKAEIRADNKLGLYFMSDEFTRTKFDTPRELIKHVKKNHAEPGFFDEAYVFERETIK